VGDLVRVVAAAVLRESRVLAARRRAPHRLAGSWEFPGGKVEPGEDDRAALVRECREELDIEVQVGRFLGAATADGLQIVLYAAELVAGNPQVRADHDELRWLPRGELDGLPWLPIDRELLPAVRAVLP
jgi:8-oxo-dGTP diphosphatase